MKSYSKFCKIHIQSVLQPFLLLWHNLRWQKKYSQAIGKTLKNSLPRLYCSASCVISYHMHIISLCMVKSYFTKMNSDISRHTIRKCKKMTGQNAFQILLLNDRRTLRNKNENAVYGCPFEKITFLLRIDTHFLKAHFGFF